MTKFETALNDLQGAVEYRVGTVSRDRRDAEEAMDRVMGIYEALMAALANIASRTDADSDVRDCALVAATAIAAANA